MRTLLGIGMAAVFTFTLVGCDKEAARKKAIKVYKQYYTSMLMAIKNRAEMDNEGAMHRAAKANGFKDWNDFAVKMVEILGPDDWMKVTKDTAEWFQNQVKKLTDAIARGEEWEPEGGVEKITPDKAASVLEDYFRRCLEAEKNNMDLAHEPAQEEAAAANDFMGWEDFVGRAFGDLGAESWKSTVDRTVRRFQAERKKIEEARANEAERERAIAKGPLTRDKVFLVFRDFYAFSLEGGRVLECRDRAAKKYGFSGWDDFVTRARDLLNSETWIAVMEESHRWYKERKKKLADAGGAMVRPGHSPRAVYEKVFREFYGECVKAMKKKQEIDTEKLQREVARANGFEDWNDYFRKAIDALGVDGWQQIVEEATEWYKQEVKRVMEGMSREAGDSAEGREEPAKPPAPVPGSNLSADFRPGARMGDATAKEFYTIKQVLADWIRADRFKVIGGSEHAMAKDEWVHVPSKGWTWIPYPK